MKIFILTRVDEIYLDALCSPKFRFKRKTLRQFMDLLIDDFQATPEERVTVRKLIEAPWDPNQHIIKLFVNLKKHLTTLGEMKNVIPYPDEDFIEALYMVVKKTKQFTKVCEKWKRKPLVDRSTKAQAREYFKGVYEISDTRCNSFHEMGVANNVVMQERPAILET